MHWLPRLIAWTLPVLLLASSFVPPWELFHDEFYYWVGAQRLELGYVDHPPLAPWLLRAVTAVVGDGRLGLRIVPALCATGTILLTAGMARRFGAGPWGQTIAALAVATAPIFLIFYSFYSVNALELLLWTAICRVLAELAHDGDERRWLLIGALTGVAALNKHTVLLLGAGLTAGLLVSPLRSHLRGRWVWLGGGIALLIALPNLVWNAVHDWPSLAFYQNRGAGILPATFGEALELQITGFNPANVLLWLPGLLFLVFSTRARPYRPLGIAFGLLLVAILFSGQRRGDRIAGVYPIVFAAGAAYWDQWRGRGAAALRAGLPVVVLGLGVFLSPASLTFFPPERVEAFFRAIDQRPEIETGDVGQWMPLTLLGRLEWKRFGEEVFAAVDALPEEVRARAVILSPHWVYAGVIEYYGRERDLPPVVSPHNAYYFWREAAVGRDRVIAVAIPRDVLERYFGEVRLLALFECQRCTGARPDIPVFLAQGSERPLVELLEEWRAFDIRKAPALSDSL
jgi:hypothetical protein